MTDTSSTRPVRVPNVSPHARSGLSGEVIGSNAAEAYDKNVELGIEPTTAHVPSGVELGEQLGGLEYTGESKLIVPQGDLDSHLAWVREGETEEERSERADAVFTYAKNEVEPFGDEQQAWLSGELRGAVYQVAAEDTAGDAVAAVPEDLTTVEDLLGWVKEAETSDEQAARARAVLAAEEQRTDSEGQPDPRKTLVDPLEALLEPAGD